MRLLHYTGHEATTRGRGCQREGSTVSGSRQKVKQELSANSHIASPRFSPESTLDTVYLESPMGAVTLSFSIPIPQPESRPPAGTLASP